MAKKPWGGAGAWAVESELAEAQFQELEQQQQQARQPPSLFAGDAAFPSLGEAASTKIPKKKKQSLAQFMASGAPPFSESKGLTTEEKMALPTGPRDRSGEQETLGGLGGGFRDYGGYRGEGRDRDYGRDREGGYGGRRSDREGGFGRGFAGDRDGPEEQSRADTVDDWGATKKSAPPSRGRYDDRDFASRADDDSHWGSSKRFVPANGAGRRVSKYDFSSARTGADDADNWGASKKAPLSGAYDSFGQRDRDYWNFKEKDGINSDSWTHREAERATERPRLVLQPPSQRSDSSPPLPPKEDTENQPPSSEASAEQAPKPQKVNPFGQAKPREVVLEEKGMNWKELDAEINRKSQDRSNVLKEEIKALQDALKLAEDGSNEEGTESNEGIKMMEDLKEQLREKEEELEQLRATSGNDKRSSSFWGPSERKDSDVWTKLPNNGPSNDRKNSGVWSRQSSNGQGNERKDPEVWSRQSNSGTGSEKKDFNVWSRQPNVSAGSERRESDAWSRQPNNGWSTSERRGGHW